MASTGRLKRSRPCSAVTSGKSYQYMFWTPGSVLLCRGYTAFQLESLSVDPTQQKEGDTKEGLYFGVEVAPGSAVSLHMMQMVFPQQRCRYPVHHVHRRFRCECSPRRKQLC